MTTHNTGNRAQNPATTSQHGANGQSSGPSSNADIFTLNAQIEAPHETAAVSSTETLTAILTVKIPAFSKHQSKQVIDVRLRWRCPVCGEPRGDAFRGISYYGAVPLHCDSWNNPCGHVDTYAALRAEAAANGLNKGQCEAATVVPSTDNTEPLPDVAADESAPTDQPEPSGNGYHLKQHQKITLDEMLARQQRERGLEPMPLEAELLLKRVKDGGFSGEFLADAFLSAYRTDWQFHYSLGNLIKLDAEGFRLFHEILHIRHVPGWNDDDLYQLEQQITAIIRER